jgi:hypothetical protein
MARPFSKMPAADEGAFDRLIESIDPDWIEQALEATGTATLRKRRLPSEQVIWLVLGMALYRHRPIDELVSRLDLVLPAAGSPSVARSAVAKARARLGDEPMKWLFAKCSEKWGHESARHYAWRNLAVYGVDGTTVRVPDSPANRAHFGGQSAGAQKGESGYPLARGVTLMALRSHLLAAAQFGPYTRSEQALARELWGSIPDDSLTVVDRGFFDSKILIPLARDGRNRHWLLRAKSTSSCRTLRRLGRGDELVEFNVTSGARAADPSLPTTFVARAIAYQRKGFSPQKLFTSLLDPKKYPAREIVALYHERWELELGYDEVKTDMLERQEALRSKTPAGVAQELWAIGLAYNLVRLEMQRVAQEAGVPPTRISFVMALRLIRDEWMWTSATNSPGAVPKHLRRLREELKRFILPERRPRTYPRAVKIKMSGYARKRPGKTAKSGAK